MKFIVRGLVKSLVLMIRGYRYCISPLIGFSCRFDPSCSNYVEKALIRHGLLRGSFLGIKRILSCHPWHSGGVDPVP